jgi:hypothetical protein
MASRRRRRSGGALGALSKRITDPRRAGGGIDTTTRGVAEVGLERGEVGEAVAGIEVRGRINGTPEQARILLLATPEAAAMLAAQIIGLHRQGRLAPEFAVAFDERMKEAAGG